jgi:GTPase SAR1 family protein
MKKFHMMMIGDSGSGKSSIMSRFHDNSFTDQFVHTIGVDFKAKTIIRNHNNLLKKHELKKH